MRISLSAVLLLALSAVADSSRSESATLRFDVLPSAQGWQYFSDGASPPAETTVFTLRDSVLKMDSTPSLTAAYYYLPNVVDPSQPFKISVRARALSGVRPLGFYVSTVGALARFNLSPGAIYDETTGQVIAAVDTSIFHTYRMEGDFRTGYSMYVDDVLVGNGVIGTNNVNALLLGDTGSHGVGIAELTSYSFSQGASIPIWSELQTTGTPPTAQVEKTVHFDAANNRLIVFYSGRDLNEVWILTNANGLGGSSAWVKLEPLGTRPQSNGLESVVYDVAQNRLIVYGGCAATCSPALSDVFVLSNANGRGGTPVWSRLTVSNPQAREAHSAVFDASTNQMIAFGGGLAFFGTDKNDTRRLSNANGATSPSAWTAGATAGGPPGIRESHSAVHDEARSRMLIFGGDNLVSTCCPYVISQYNDAWMLSNANGVSGVPTWNQVSAFGTPPRPRSYHSAVYDQARDRMIVFGGLQWNQTAQTYTTLDDLWELRNATARTGAPEWAQLSQTGSAPGEQVYQSAAYDETNQRMIVLAGSGSNRVWVLDLTGGSGPGTNRNPVANAGPGLSVATGTTVTLSGAGSTDPDGDTLRFSWWFVRKPQSSTAVLANATTATPSFRADIAGSYTVQLDVSDGKGGSASARVVVTAGQVINRPPVANAGPDQTVNLNSTVRLNGGLSKDPDGVIPTYSWWVTTPSGTVFLPTNSRTSTPYFVARESGAYTARLTVSDGQLSATDSAVISVSQACSPAPTCKREDDGSWHYYQCNGRQITQQALNTSQRVDDFRLVGCTAVWRFNSSTSSVPDRGDIAYFSNDARNPGTVKQLTQGTSVASSTFIKEFKVHLGGIATWNYDSVTGQNNPFDAYYANCIRSPVLSPPYQATPQTQRTGNWYEVIENFAVSDKTFTWQMRNPDTNTSTQGTSTFDKTCAQP